jgi:hypothetical protein
LPHLSFPSFIKTKQYATVTDGLIPINMSTVAESATYSSGIELFLSVNSYILIIYMAGVVFFLAKLINSGMTAARIIANSNIEQIKGLNVNVTEDNIRAFTYMSKIIIGRNILNHPSLLMILFHESVHSKEKHFYDIFLAELLFGLQWFNPFAWFYRDAIRNNLEYRADDVVIRDSDASEYQLAMLSLVQSRIKPSMFTEFNSSNLKKRIIMMKSENKKRFSGIARFAVLPILALLILSLSAKETIIIHDNTMVEHNEKQMYLKQLVADEEISEVKLKSMIGLRRHIAAHIKYPKEAADAGQTGVCEYFVTISADGMVENVTENQIGNHFIEIDEIVIVASGENSQEISESSSHESLVSEGRRIVNSLPKLEIPEWYGKTIKMKFKFELQ